MAKTPLQPTLPGEVDFTDAEHDFIESSPEGLFPENQDSNFGLLRKTWTDKTQELIGQQDTIYKERFVATSVDYLDMWEVDVGLPSSRSASRTVAQRQLDVLSRMIKGPFTVPLRNRIIENAITATFGAPFALVPAGVPLSASGIPLYSEAAEVTTLYSVRDNTPSGRNLLPNGNFENNVTGWGHDASLSAFAISTAQRKFGLSSARGVAAGASPYIYYNSLVNALAGNRYTASCWVYSPRAATAGAVIQWRTADGNTVISTVQQTWQVPANAWTRIAVSGQSPAGTGKADPIFQFTGMTVGDVIYWDGAQLEFTPVPSGVNKFAFGNFNANPISEWSANNATITSDGSIAHEGNASAQVAFTTASNFANYVYCTQPVNYTAGKTFTLSAWVYATGAAVGKSVRLQLNETGGTITEEAVGFTDAVLVAGWQRIKFTGTLVRDDRTAVVVYFIQVSPVIFTVNLDSIQLEQGSEMAAYSDPVLASSFVDPEKTPYYYEVRISNSITPDMTSLIRELERITPASIAFDVNSVPPGEV